MISFCQFGAGRIAVIHAAKIARHPGTRLKTVVDIDPVAAARLASRHGAAVVAQGGVPLMLGFNRRFDPHFARLERHATGTRRPDRAARYHQPRPRRRRRVKVLALADAALESPQTRRGGYSVTYSSSTSRNGADAMDLETYKSSLAGDGPPAGLSLAAQALWW